jgi:hypothetical protein
MTAPSLERQHTALWLVREEGGWGTRTFVVRAIAREQALALVGLNADIDESRVEVAELPHDGEPGIVWEEEEWPELEREKD